MPSRPSANVWLAIGASLAISGGFAIVTSLPEGGTMLWVGVALIATGSLALRMGLSQADSGTESAGIPEMRPADARSVEPELLRPPPRQVQMTRRGWMVVAVWMLALATFAVLSYEHFAKFPPPAMKERIDGEGRETVAEFHSREVRAMPDGRTLFFLGYSFAGEASGQVRISRSVPRRLFVRLAEGDRTRVLYLRENPELHYLPELTSPVSTRLVFFAGGLLLAAAGFAEAQRRRHRRLVASGAAVAGFIADVRRRGGVRSFRVNYDVGGVRKSMSARERNPDLRNGQRATVLYDPSAYARAIVYRLALYRVRQ